MTASIPIILFAREPEISCNQMVEVQADCLSLYWKTKDIDLAFLNGKVALQGNLNPEILLQEDNVIKNEADRILKQFKHASKMAKKLSGKNGMKDLQNMISGNSGKSNFPN